jgi:hypothetical protein
MTKREKKYRVVFTFWPESHPLQNHQFLRANKEFQDGTFTPLADKTAGRNHVVLMAASSFISALRAGVLRGEAKSEAERLVERLGETRGLEADIIWKEEFVNVKVQPGGPVRERSSSGPVQMELGPCSESGWKQESVPKGLEGAEAEDRHCSVDAAEGMAIKGAAAPSPVQEAGKDIFEGAPVSVRVLSEVFRKSFGSVPVHEKDTVSDSGGHDK